MTSGSIFLCGFMGAGKSSLGRKLAECLQLPFLDLDERIEADVGQPIPDIFKRAGEEGFRKQERRALERVIKEQASVIALGGGTLQNKQLAQRIKQSGVLVFLEVPLSLMVDRIYGDSNRPLLLDEHGDPKSRQVLKEELLALYKKRLPLYKEADIILSVEPRHSIPELTEQLIKQIKLHVNH